MYLTANFKGTFRRVAALLCLVFAIVVLVEPAYAAQGIQQGLQTCYQALIPSLFPFLFIVDYLFSYLCARANKKTWFSIAAAVVFGLCGGFPMGAKALSDLVARGEISAKKASFLMCGCANAGPAYLISAVGIGLFGNSHAGILLFVALSAASLLFVLAALIFCTKKRDDTVKPTRQAAASAPGFTASISYALGATLSLCAYVVFFTCIGSYFNAAADAVSGGPILKWALNAMLEVATGCIAAADVGSVSGLLLAAATVSLCGISVTLQLRSITQKSNITLKYFLASRPIHAAITLLILDILIPLFPSVEDVFADTIVYRIYTLSPLFSFFFILVAVIFVLSDKRATLFAKR